MNKATLAVISLGVATALSFASAKADTFAEYSVTSNASNLSWTQSNDFLSGTLDGSGSVYFTYLSGSASGLANLPATFTLTATAPGNDPATMDGAQVTQADLSGSFSFVYTGSTPLTVGSNTYSTGANLLTGTFSGAEIVGPASGSTGSAQDSILAGGNVSYTSALESFAATGDKGFALEFTSALPSLSAFPGSSLNSFTAVSTGSFSSDLSSSGGAGGVPEPAVWALMLVGFGGVGGMLRLERRRRSTTFA